MDFDEHRCCFTGILYIITKDMIFNEERKENVNQWILNEVHCDISHDVEEQKHAPLDFEKKNRKRKCVKEDNKIDKKHKIETKERVSDNKQEKMHDQEDNFVIVTV